MNIWDVIIGLLLLFIIVWALYQIVRNRHSCDGVCSSCHNNCRLKG